MLEEAGFKRNFGQNRAWELTILEHTHNDQYFGQTFTAWKLILAMGDCACPPVSILQSGIHKWRRLGRFQDLLSN